MMIVRYSGVVASDHIMYRGQIEEMRATVERERQSSIAGRMNDNKCSLALTAMYVFIHERKRLGMRESK